jgi:hypothetical protein
MSFINDSVLDAAVAKIVSDCDRLDICSAEPVSWANIGTMTLGNKASPTLSAAQDGVTNGRRTVVSAITDGTVTATGTAGFWSLTDSGTAVMAAYSLSATQAVTSGNTFTLTSFSVTFPDPA